MRKILTFSFLFISLIGFSQELEVTSNGLKDKENPEKNYVVINCANKTKSELYDNAIKYINEKYKNPDEVIKGKTKNEYLRFETYAGQFIKVNNSGAKLDVSAKYYTELRFKDGKVRYEITNLNMTADNGGRNVHFQGSIWKGYPIFKKSGKLRLEKTKEDLENYFNSQIKTLSDFLNDKKSKKDDW